MRVKTVVASIAVLALLGAAGIKMYRNYNMVCGDTGRRLSEEEVIRLAIARVLVDQERRAKTTITEPGYAAGSEGVEPLPPGITTPVKIYGGVEDFIRENPGCCAAKPNDSIDADTFLYLMGGGSTTVDLVYRRYIVGPTPYARASISINRCGGVGDYIFDHAQDY